MKPVVFALAAGLLLAFSLPPFDIEWLGWFAFAPVLVAAAGRRELEAMGLGMLAGLVCGFVHAGWPSGASGLLFAYLPFLWLAILLGLVAALGASARRRWDGARWVTHVACAGVAAEWLTTFSPLPLNVAVCEHALRPLLQLAALTGIWGISFLLWWSNAALADAVLRRRPRTAPLALALAGLIAALAYGGLVIARSSRTTTPRLRVAAIQDYTLEESGHPAPAGQPEEAPDREELTRRAAARGARLIVWSEGGLGAAYAPDAPINPTADLARELRTYLVVGYTEPARPLPFNAAAIVAPDGSIQGIYRKIHLFLGERQSVQPGREARAFATPLGKVGVEICFDTCYTGVTRSIAASGARILAMPDYDPPTPRSVLHRLHAAVLPFRAVENRIPFVRADPTGLSQIVDATGRVLAESPLFTADALVADVPLGDGRGSLFTRLGDWVAYVCLLITAAGLVRLRGAPVKHVSGMPELSTD